MLQPLGEVEFKISFLDRIKVKGKAVYMELVKIHLYRSKNNKVKSIIMGSFDAVDDYINKMLGDDK